jgi:signal peptidase I
MESSPSAGLLLLMETLRSRGAGTITLRGGSMLPTLQDGWRVQVQAVSGSDLEIGDIGVFLHGGSLTIHRLVWRKRSQEKESLVFQGDNNVVRETVGPESVLGRVVAAEAERTDGTFSPRFPVGGDSRARFYRLAHRSHDFVSRRFPGLRIPDPGASPGAVYRLFRAVFRSLEGIVSPRPRR